MSSISLTWSTPTPSPSSTPDTADSKGKGTGASNLYLFTFLATLCLLLFVSCSIVARSFVIRRRYTRRINEALASGRLLSPRAQGARKRQFVEKPKFYNAWVTPGGVGWDSIMPVSAHVLSKAPPQRDNRNSEHSTTTTTTRPLNHERRLSHRPSLFSILSRSSDRRHNNNVTPNPESESDDRHHSKKVQVSVLVAMPRPPQPPSTTDVTPTVLEKDEIPNIVLGVTHIFYTTKNSR